MAKHSEDKISGVQKAAILLITLGPEKSANIFKHLKEEEIEELTLEIANTRSVTPQRRRSLRNFIRSVLHSNILLKAELIMQRNFWRRHLVRKRQWMLSAN